jgi:hypothetical protein
MIPLKETMLQDKGTTDNGEREKRGEENPLSEKLTCIFKSAEAMRKVKTAVEEADYELSMKKTILKMCSQHGQRELDSLFLDIMGILNDDYGYKVKVENVAECPVCFETYKDECCLLPCSHIVCEKCLHDLKNNAKMLGRKSILCPVCRSSTTFARIKRGVFS